MAAQLGYRFGSSFALPKILWLKQRRPEVYARCALFASPTDYVIGWLTGAWARTDQTNALKWGYDLIEDRWPDFIEGRLGISRALLPAVFKPGAKAGRVTPERAKELGLPAGTPVASGMTDGCASQVAAGAVRGPSPRSSPSRRGTRDQPRQLGFRSEWGS
jgi:sugar (pentulose or hexulose) kinase